MSLLRSDRSVVAVIDMQGKLMSMIERPEAVRQSTLRLLQLADLFEVPVVLTEQYPAGLGATHPEILAAFDDLSPEHSRVEKDSFSCCQEPKFASALEKLRPDPKRQVVVAGIEAHICVVQTVIELLEAGTETFVCWDCVSGRGEEYRRSALSRMEQAGASITNCESVGFEWARDKNHARFRDMSRLFREGQPS